MENPKKLILRKFAEMQTLSGRKTEFILFAVPEPVGHTRPNERYLHNRASGAYTPERREVSVLYLGESFTGDMKYCLYNLPKCKTAFIWRTLCREIRLEAFLE